jgi:hypothetical protein
MLQEEANSKRKFPHEKARSLSQKRPIATSLGLHKDSPIPRFASQLPFQQLKQHPEMRNWHHHREMLLKGHISKEELPDHLKPLEDKRDFRIIATEKKKGRSGRLGNEKVYKTSIQERNYYQNRREILAQLGLHDSSALPTFASRISLDELKSHGELDQWHSYRQLLEAGRITNDELPTRFKTYTGTYRFLKPQTKAKADAKRKASAVLNQANKVPRKEGDHNTSASSQQMTSHQADVSSPSPSHQDVNEWAIFRKQLGHHNDGDKENDDIDWSELHSLLS